MEWIVIANKTKVRIFRPHKTTKKLVLVKEITNEAGRERSRNLIRHKPGSSVKSFPQMTVRSASHAVAHRGATASRLSPQDDIAIKFSKKIADHLDRLRKLNGFDTLTIVAEPKFLGKLKSAMSTPTLKKVANWQYKDLQKRSKAELERLFLGPPPRQ